MIHTEVLIHAVLDSAGRGALEESVKLTHNKDRIITIVDFDTAGKLGVCGIRSRRSTERLARLAGLYTEGKLCIHIRKTYPVHLAADAHREVESGHGRGKVVLLL